MLSLVITFSIFFLVATPSGATNLHFQTTRLKSTAGTGVASFTVDEASILNPASLGFFNLFSLYFQKSGGEFKGVGRQSSISQSENKAIIISDTKGPLKGSVSYAKLSDRKTLKKQMGVSFASIVGPQSSLGLTYRKTWQKNRGYSREKETEQFVLGIMHAVSPAFSLGMAVVDPQGKIEQDRKALVGIQYVYKKFISLMFDIGADYTRELSETTVYKQAVQFKFLSDFYIRFGSFKEKVRRKKGTGTGLSWISPKLILDFSLSNNLFEKDQIKEKETSFSISYRF